MTVIKEKISDGVNFSYIKTDKFKTNFISVNFICPLSEESASENALLPYVLCRGTEKYKTKAKINERLQYLFAADIAVRNVKRGENQIFGFKADMLNNAYASDDTDITRGMAELLSQLIFHPQTENGAFVGSYVESEKTSLCDAIKAKINNKNRYSMMRCYEEMCRGERFSVSESGKTENVEAITARALFEHYKKVLSSYSVEIYFVGNGDFKCVSDIFAKEFSGICRGGIQKPASPQVIRHAGAVKEIDEPEAVKQGKLCLGFRTDFVMSDGKYYEMRLFNEIFGGSPTSKLFMNVREKMSLCYYCSSYPESQKGTMIVASGIEVKNRDIAQKAILSQLSDIANGQITDEDMDSAVRSLRNGYMQVSDSAEALETWYLVRCLCGASDTPGENISGLETVTKERIAQIAKNITLDTVYFLRGTLK